MSAPVNFNTTSFEELKTVLLKNKSYVVLEACKKAGGHLTIKAFHSATRMSQEAFQKMVNDSAIVYEVESSMQTPLQITPPPSSEENSPVPTGEDQSVPGDTANLGESGFQLTPAKFPYTPSGPPYIDNPSGGLMPANAALEPNNVDPSSHKWGYWKPILTAIASTNHYYRGWRSSPSKRSLFPSTLWGPVPKQCWGTSWPQVPKVQ